MGADNCARWLTAVARSNAATEDGGHYSFGATNDTADLFNWLTPTPVTENLVAKALSRGVKNRSVALCICEADTATQLAARLSSPSLGERS